MEVERNEFGKMLESVIRASLRRELFHTVGLNLAGNGEPLNVLSREMTGSSVF